MKATIIPTNHVLKCDLVPNGETLEFHLRMSHMPDLPVLVFACLSIGMLADSEGTRKAAEALARAAAITCSILTKSKETDLVVEDLTIDWEGLDALAAPGKREAADLLELLGSLLGTPKMGALQ